jgi:hypothetical protein
MSENPMSKSRENSKDINSGSIEISRPKEISLPKEISFEPGIRSKETPTINEALNEYYKLKSNYEVNYHEKYIKPIIRSNTKSKREKRLEYQKLPKPECINCKRNVGSIFSIKKDPEEYSRTFIATCGDITDPCPLNINIDYTFRNELNKELLSADADINVIKNSIIIDKNNMMFGYIEQKKAIAQFNVNAAELKSITEGAGFVLDINIQLNDNPIKKELINSNEHKLGNEFLIPFKDMIKTFDQTGNTEVLNKAMKFYVEEMIPLITTIRNLKYQVCYVDFIKQKDLNDSDEKGDLNFLIQKQNSLSNLEFTLYGNDELISFVKGVRDVKDVKTRKNLEQIHKKTRKLKPSIELVEVDEEDLNEVLDEGPQRLDKDITMVEDQPFVPAESPGLEDDIMPHIEPGGQVIWKNTNDIINNEYQQIWNILKPEYKYALLEDEAWMKKTMDHFVEFARLKKAKKVPYMAAREFVHPDGLLLPPKQISETEYDFGNVFYNKLLNKENKKPTLLLSFLPKPGPVLPKTITDRAFPNVDDNVYRQYLNALASIIGNTVKFTTF